VKLALIRRLFSATGGAELYLQRLLSALLDAGHEVHLFAESWPDLPAHAVFHPVAVTGSRATRPWRFADALERELSRASWDCVFSLERTRRQDVYRAGDGVHRVWLERRRQYARWWRRPWVGRGAFHRTMLELEAQVFDPARTGHIIVNSEMVGREIRAHYRFPEARLHLVRNGVPLDRFASGDRAAARAQLGVKPDEFLLLFVGSGWERKGLRFLLRALDRFVWARLRDTFTRGLAAAQTPRDWIAAFLPDSGAKPELRLKLLVVGKGRPPTTARPYVIFAGPRSDLEQIYAAADLFVFLPIYEPSANVCFEALAAGLPVVTTAQNGASEVIEDGVNGTVLDTPTDTGAVVQAIGYWWARRFRVPFVETGPLSLTRNVEETLAVIELAAAERRARAAPN